MATYTSSQFQAGTAATSPIYRQYKGEGQPPTTLEPVPSPGDIYISTTDPKGAWYRAENSWEHWDGLGHQVQHPTLPRSLVPTKARFTWVSTANWKTTIDQFAKRLPGSREDPLLVVESIINTAAQPDAPAPTIRQAPPPQVVPIAPKAIPIDLDLPRTRRTLPAVVEKSAEAGSSKKRKATSPVPPALTPAPAVKATIARPVKRAKATSTVPKATTPKATAPKDRKGKGKTVEKDVESEVSLVMRGLTIDPAISDPDGDYEIDEDFETPTANGDRFLSVGTQFPAGNPIQEWGAVGIKTHTPFCTWRGINKASGSKTGSSLSHDFVETHTGCHGCPEDGYHTKG